jgi:hypothetical protein
MQVQWSAHLYRWNILENPPENCECVLVWLSARQPSIHTLLLNKRWWTVNCFLFMTKLTLGIYNPFPLCHIFILSFVSIASCHMSENHILIFRDFFCFPHVFKRSVHPTLSQLLIHWLHRIFSELFHLHLGLSVRLVTSVLANMSCNSLYCSYRSTSSHLLEATLHLLLAMAATEITWSLQISNMAVIFSLKGVLRFPAVKVLTHTY